MVNIDTLIFLDLLHDLAKRLKAGAIPFSELFSNEDKELLICYDDTKGEAIEDDYQAFPIVCDCLIVCEHHDIISDLDNAYAPDGEYSIKFMKYVGMDQNKTDDYIIVKFQDCDHDICIEDGHWSIIW